MADQVSASIRESIEVKRAMLRQLLPEINQAAFWLIETFSGSGKVLLCGNGGSAADAQHLAAEFVGRFERERQPWPAIALCVDTSALTAIANDYGVDAMFARQVEALGSPGDLLIAFSTSGCSPNVLAAARAARARGMRVIGFTGQGGGDLGECCDLMLRVPSCRTARIQEAHITLCHALCEAVETALATAET